MIDLRNMLYWTERVYLEGDDTSSKDPLGTEAFAGHLADLILPGMTTITWRVRYVTLICQWIDFINNDLRVKGVDEIINRIMQIEKLAAFSMVTKWGSSNVNNSVSEDDERDDVNLKRLIGKRYARAFFNCATTFSLNKKDYPFLTNHKSAGAYSVYKVLLMSLGLLDEYTVCLTEKGKDLIEGIELSAKAPSFIKKAIAGEDIELKSSSFITIGEYWGLSKFASDTERQRLKGLMVSESRRRGTFELLRKYKKNNGHYEVISDIAEKDIGAKDVVDVFKYIQKFERVNREVHFLFHSLLSTGADQIRIDQLLKDNDVKKSIAALTGRPMNDYLNYHENNEQILQDAKWIPDDWLFEFYRDLYELKGNPQGLLERIITHHSENQKRKSKVPWVDYKDGKCTIILHRYKNEGGNPFDNRGGVVHNYRLNNAWRMIDDLGI
jgi:hypothetical protein